MTNYLSMKVLSCILIVACLRANTSLAQTTTSKRVTATTQTGSTTVVSNHQQELYDQYHGYNKKAVTTSTSVTPAVTSADKTSTNQSSVARTASSSTTDVTKSSPKKLPNQPTDQPVATTTTRTERPRQPNAIEGSPSSRFRIGIRGGVTYPFFLDGTSYPIAPGINAVADPVLGFAGGITFTFGAGAISFQPEVNYVRNSLKISFLNLTTTYATDVIQVPLLLKFSSGSYAGSRFFVNVGPYASYATSASQDGKKYSLDSTPGRFGFGAAAGIGAAIKAGPGHVTLEVRGLYSLGDTDTGFNTDSRTISGQGTIGYIFPLGGVR